MADMCELLNQLVVLSSLVAYTQVAKELVGKARINANSA